MMRLYNLAIVILSFVIIGLNAESFCKDTCLRNGGSIDCIEECGCSSEKKNFLTKSFCNEICKETCLRNGGGKVCIEACGCSNNLRKNTKYLDQSLDS